MDRIANAVALSIPNGESHNFGSAVVDATLARFEITVYNYTGSNPLNVTASVSPLGGYTVTPVSVPQDEYRILYITPDTSAEGIFNERTLTVIANGSEIASIGLNLRVITPTANFIEMVPIPAGTFDMGSPDYEPGRYSDVDLDSGNFDLIYSNRELQHEVTLTEGFYMGKYEVTQAQWVTVMNTTIYEHIEDLTKPRWQNTQLNGTPQPNSVGDNYPMYYVGWYDALVFCNRLSIMEELSPAYRIDGSTNPDDWGPVPTNRNNTWDNVTIVPDSEGYRLPTEAQWEYACCAGTTTAYNTGDTMTDDTGWYAANSNSSSQLVGQKPANAWGLHDMHGNVWEICFDWYADYTADPKTDPIVMFTDAVGAPVMRGGGYSNAADIHVLRSAYRGSSPETVGGAMSNVFAGTGLIGFRVVRS